MKKELSLLDASRVTAEGIVDQYVPTWARAHFSKAQCKIVTLAPGERYLEASGALSRLAINVDAWPSPPAGLFVVEERTIYLRSLSTMTVVHEYGHALDCALGGGIYQSGIDVNLRTEFADASAFVTPYAATGLDEYFAEGFRAYCEANDPQSTWPRATRQRLQTCAPALAAYFDQLSKGTP